MHVEPVEDDPETDVRKRPFIQKRTFILAALGAVCLIAYPFSIYFYVSVLTPFSSQDARRTVEVSAGKLIFVTYAPRYSRDTRPVVEIEKSSYFERNGIQMLFTAMKPEKGWIYSSYDNKLGGKRIVFGLFPWGCLIGFAALLLFVRHRYFQRDRLGRRVKVDASSPPER